MSFSGGAGYKSPFTERAKASKSHLSPRRTSTVSGVGNSRGVQQSLFGKESQFSDTSTKVGQFRTPQPDVKEPTTPTRASEGSNSKANRRDEFSSFNSRRLGTPVKTPRTAFGTIPPRSPIRPYMGSPKYQKVLVERPAFYNSPAAEDSTTESGKKEVSISELQKRLKRFLQDENVPTHSELVVVPATGSLDDVPFSISRSPRVNPLFHHDSTTLQVAKGGVAFTAGVTDDNSLFNSPEPLQETQDHSGRLQFAKGGVAFTAGATNNTCTHNLTLLSKEQVSVASHGKPPLETVPVLPLVPQPVDETASSTDASSFTSEPSEMQKPLSSEDFPVHSESVDESPVEEVCDADCDDFHGPGAVAPETSNPEELTPPRKQHRIATTNSTTVEVLENRLSEEAAVVNSSSDERLEEALEGGAASHHQLESAAIPIEEEEEETEILEFNSWRFLRFVALAVMVACVMGLMVLASGIQGLLPKNLQLKHLTSPMRSSPCSRLLYHYPLASWVWGREYEGMPCLPEVHLGLKFLSSTPNYHREASSPSGLCNARTVSQLVEIDDVLDLDQLKTVTEHYKELQGRLLSDVASLTTSEIVTSAEVGATEDLLEPEDVSVLADERVEEQQVESRPYADVLGGVVAEATFTAQTLESLQNTPDSISELASDESPATVESDALSAVNPVSYGPHVVRESNAFFFGTKEGMCPILENSVAHSESEEDTPSPLDWLPLEVPASDEILVVSNDKTSQSNEEESPNAYPVTSFTQGTDEEVNFGILEDVDALLDHHEMESLNTHHEEPQSESATEVVDSYEDSAQTLPEAVRNTPVQIDVVHEEDLYSSEESFLPVATIGLLVAALAIALPFLLKTRKSPTVTLAAAIQAETAADRSLFPDTMCSPVAWPASHSVYDSHFPDRDELDAISSPLKITRRTRNYGIESQSFKYGKVEPALSAPSPFQPPSRVEQKPAMTWHPAMKGGTNTISSSYRQTASFVPSFPSESSISTSTRGGSDTDTVCESALTMGAEEWEHLGSFTTTELISVNERGEEHQKRTPVRRSQRIRNKVSPLPVRFT